MNFVDNGRVTYHHNWFDHGNGRNPKVGGEPARLHFFNNYWSNIGYFCVTAQADAQVRLESSYFEDSLLPHWLQLDGGGKAGIAIDRDSVYTGKSNGDSGGAVFTPPYPYEKTSAMVARTAIMRCAGPQPIR